MFLNIYFSLSQETCCVLQLGTKMCYYTPRVLTLPIDAKSTDNVLENIPYS